MPEGSPTSTPETVEPEPPEPSRLDRLKRLLLGAPRSLSDRSLSHRLTLIPFLAWVGLGADGLSSSSYGPDEAFRTVLGHEYLLVALAAMTAVTVFIIAAAYSRLIEDFPLGGGYVVATKVLGRRAGVVSGSALLVDYVLTISVSIAAAGDALFSFLPYGWQVAKLPIEAAIIIALTLLNMRGVRESVLTLMPIFVVFLVTHVVGIVGGLVAHAPEVPETASRVATGFSHGTATLGMGGLLLLFLHAYSMGGGTYTGIEAVSNGLPIMREPRVQTAKRTMTYMAVSLAFTAAGILICYLLWSVTPTPGKTMNAVLWERLTASIPGGTGLVIVTLLSEGALLFVAAQAGFIGGPRVLANMAVDSWVPHRFSSLSDRLTTQNGIILMGGASLLILLQAKGDVRHLVVMYSINVFLTFSLSMLGMTIHMIKTRSRRRHWKRRTVLFASGLVLCLMILGVTTIVKFKEGGWLTVVVTSAVLVFCILIRGHYRLVGTKLAKLYAELNPLLSAVPPVPASPPPAVDPRQPTAVLLAADFGGLGVHTMLNIFRSFPNHFRNLVIVSVGVVDSGEFKGDDVIDPLRERTENSVRKYVDLATRLGVPATSRIAIGTDAVDEAERLCLEVAKEFPRAVFFAGKIIFRREQWFQRLLHNETAFAIQKRMQWAGRTMVVLPARVR